jgi:hypothetical protein
MALLHILIRSISFGRPLTDIERLAQGSRDQGTRKIVMRTRSFKGVETNMRVRFQEKHIIVRKDGVKFRIMD